MRDLIFDTETTGLVKPSAPLEKQPHPVQLAFMLREGTQIYALGNVIINCGVEPDPRAYDAHGIGMETMQLFGITPGAAVALFLSVLDQADRLVAHNIDFDLTVMAAAIFRAAGEEADRSILKPLINKPRICTMKTATPIMQLPGPYGFKWPKLIEAYKHFVDPEGFEGAHDALADVRACAAVLDALEACGAKLHDARY